MGVRWRKWLILFYLWIFKIFHLLILRYHFYNLLKKAIKAKKWSLMLSIFSPLGRFINRHIHFISRQQLLTTFIVPSSNCHLQTSFDHLPHRLCCRNQHMCVFRPSLSSYDFKIHLRLKPSSWFVPPSLQCSRRTYHLLQPPISSHYDLGFI